MSDSLQNKKIEIPDRMYFRIGDVSDLLQVKPYVLRYWESEFSIVSPEKSSTGQRMYKRSDVEALLLIKNLLYVEKYSIDGARRRIREMKRDGNYHSYKQEKLYGIGTSKSAKLALEKCKAIVADLQQLASQPIDQMFRY